MITMTDNRIDDIVQPIPGKLSNLGEPQGQSVRITRSGCTHEAKRTKLLSYESLWR
jgi:hypothetical protein